MSRHSLARPPVSHLAPKWRFASGRQHMVPAVFLLMTVLAACQGSGAGSASPSASQTGSPAHTLRGRLFASWPAAAPAAARVQSLRAPTGSARERSCPGWK